MEKTNMQLVDIGINLTHRSFQADLTQVIQDAFDAGVTTLILTGTSLRGSQEAHRLAQKYPNQLFSTAGVHPHDAKSCGPQTIPSLKKLLQSPEVCAVGECGLDFNRNFSPPDVQEEWFQAQIELAIELNKPLFLHERDAHPRFLQILQSYGSQLPPAVVHCFTGEGKALQDYLDMGLYVGITGWICDERRGRHLRQLVKRIPADRLMVETDAPFLLPRDLPQKPKDPRRNEPSYLPHILKTVASCRNEDPEQTAEITTQNARQFFRLPQA
ncbi:MAG: TatD family hydrolase [Myxococcales bacterium]|nr:TatD family hydrolase [Myxococcales bacterium]